MRLQAAFLVVLVALAGCTTATDEPPAEELAPGEVVFVEDYALENASIPAEELSNATLGAEHIHDAWGERIELVLLEETLAAGDCEGTMDAAFYAMNTVFNAEGPAYGCARIALPEGVVVPEGTGELRIEVDATDALKSGGMEFQFRNKAREERLESTTEPQHVWSIPLTEADWDVAHAAATTFVMYVGAVGNGAVLEGTLSARVVAAKAEGWEPVLAIAHVDHWALPSLHDFAGENVMQLLDEEVSVTNIDVGRFTGSSPMPSPVPLQDIIAPGATQLALVVDTVSSDCAPVLTCWMVPILHVGGYARDRVGNVSLEEGARRIYVWSVPDEVPEDSVYANVSTTQIDPRIDACTEQTGCGVASLASTSVTVRVRAFAIRGELDPQALSALAP